MITSCINLVFTSLYMHATDAPPTYAEVFGVKEIQGHMQEARAEGGNPAKAGVKICNVLCGSGNLNHSTCRCSVCWEHCIVVTCIVHAIEVV